MRSHCNLPGWQASFPSLQFLSPSQTVISVPQSGLIWQDFLAPVQHFVRREMTMIHLETTSPPEVVLSREITQNTCKNLLYKLTQGIFLKYKTHCLRSTKL